MKFEFYYGPERTKVSFENASVSCKDGSVPFHGIISKGMILAMTSHAYNPEWWHHFINQSAPEQGQRKDDTWQLINDLTISCKVLSWEQSALVVREYIKMEYQDDMDDIEVQAWNMKEGHTSSVWQIQVYSNDSSTTFALNVARDYEAGIELMKTMRQLEKLQKAYPDLQIARVLDIKSVIHHSLPDKVIITRNEWISDAYEIHQRKNRISGENEFLLVEKFLTNQDNPSHITSVLGRICSKSETQMIYKYQKHFITLAKNCLAKTVEININDGDLVWSNNKTVLIALS